MPKYRILAAVVVLSTFTAPSCEAQTLNGKMNVDNAFTAYLSTQVNAVGTQILTGTDWPTTYSFSSVPLTAGQTYYLQVLAVDQGFPGGFLGDYSLTGDFMFANGLSSLTTNTTDWFASAAGFGGTNLHIFSPAPNGHGAWGETVQSIAVGTPWIWTEDNCGSCTRYFWTQITALQTEPDAGPRPMPVPEPTALALLAVGALFLTSAARRPAHL